MKTALPGPITATCFAHGFVIGLSGSTDNRLSHERCGLSQALAGVVIQALKRSASSPLKSFCCVHTAQTMRAILLASATVALLWP